MLIIAAILVLYALMHLLVVVITLAGKRRHKKPLTPQMIKDQYTESCSERANMLSADYRKGTREAEQLVRIFKRLEGNIELAEQTLPLLFVDMNIVARIKAAAHCLALKICVEQAELVLQDIVDEQSYVGFRLNAEMVLNAWHEQGYLKVYPEQEVRG